MMKLTPEFLIRINYKSGHSEQFWAKEFGISPENNIKWTCAGSYPAPLAITMGDIKNIESIWQVKVRYRFRLRSK